MRVIQPSQVSKKRNERGGEGLLWVVLGLQTPKRQDGECGRWENVGVGEPCNRGRCAVQWRGVEGGMVTRQCTMTHLTSGLHPGLHKHDIGPKYRSSMPQNVSWACQNVKNIKEGAGGI